MRVGERFVSLTSLAPFDILLDVPPYTGPPVMVGHQLEGTVLARVSSSQCIMALHDDFIAQLLDWRDIQLALEVDQAIIFLPLGEAICQP